MNYNIIAKICKTNANKEEIDAINYIISAIKNFFNGTKN